MSARKSAMAAVGADRPRLLILGSLPGDASLVAQRYYAHPTNQFWRLLGEALNIPLAGLDYADRLATLADRGIALWDVVAEAERRGSLDGAIRGHRANPLAAFVVARPELRAIAFNGGTAARLGRRALAGVEGPTLIDLPSSSAALTWPLARKAAAWARLADFAGLEPDASSSKEEP